MSTTITKTAKTAKRTSSAKKAPAARIIRTDLAFDALCSKRGATAEQLQQAAGWVRKPSRFHLQQFAANWNKRLVETDSKNGPVFRFV